MPLHVPAATPADVDALDTRIDAYETAVVLDDGFVGLGTATPSYHLHVAANEDAARVFTTLENTAASGSGSSGFQLKGRGKVWYVVTDIGENGNDNLSLMSETAGYPPMLFLTPTAVGVANDSPGSMLDVNGAITIRGDNGLSPLRIRGRTATPGAPEAGTWTAGDLVIDSAGAWHLCTASGSPGTWT